jgi:hypothetical protein
MKKQIHEAINLIKEAHEIVSSHLSNTDNSVVLSNLEASIRGLEKSNRKLVLLNYEGDVLSLIQEGSHFSVIDQWGNSINRLARHEVLAFISGEIKIRDSRGNQYCYPEHSSNAKPTPLELDLFLYGIL